MHAHAYSCVDLGTSNLTRGSESKNVLMLQQFLYAKGLLSATPNGYFGNATFSAVKAYQKSIGLSQVGNTGPATRAALKKESCTTTQTTNSSQSSPGNTTVSQTSSSTQQVRIAPGLVSFDTGTLFINASTSWNPVLQGTVLSTSTNTVYFKHVSSGKKYSIGVFNSDSNTKITLPHSLTKNTYSCGSSCSEMLPAGEYDVTVANEGGESNPIRTKIVSFSISSSSGSPYASIKQMATGTLLGVVSFSAAVPYQVVSVSAQVESQGLQGGYGLTNIITKDEVTKEVLPTSDSLPSLSAYQSKIIGVYGDIESYTSGYIYGTVVVTINDFVGKKESIFISAPFSVSVSGI